MCASRGADLGWYRTRRRHRRSCSTQRCAGGALLSDICSHCVQLPPDIEKRYVLLLDPMLGESGAVRLTKGTNADAGRTCSDGWVSDQGGGGAEGARRAGGAHYIREPGACFRLRLDSVGALPGGKQGADERPWKLILRVRFVQIASPEGLKNFCTKYPTTKVVSDAQLTAGVFARGAGLNRRGRLPGGSTRG